MKNIDRFYFRKFIKAQVELVGTDYYFAFVEFPTLADSQIGKKLIDVFAKRLVFKNIEITFVGAHLHKLLMESVSTSTIPDEVVESSSRGYMVYTKNYSAFILFLDLLSRIRVNYVVKEVVYPDQRSSELFILFSSANADKLFTSYTLKKASLVAVNNLYIGTLLPLLMYLKNK